MFVKQFRLLAAFGAGMTLLFLSSGPAPAQSAKPHPTVITDKAKIAQARRAIQAAYRAMDAAFERRDSKGMSAYDAPGYVSVNKKGAVVNREIGRKNREDFFKAAKSISARSEITSFVLQQDGAVVTIQGHMEMFIVRPKGSGNVVGDGTQRDFWIKTPKGWRQKRSREIDSTMSVNGHVLPG